MRLTYRSRNMDGGITLPLGTLVHDGPATPHQMSLWLPITDSLPQAAVATARIRTTGSGSWLVEDRKMYRPQASSSQTPPNGGLIADGFAWVFFDLSPNTSYDVEVSVVSGQTTNVKTLSAFTTRNLPAAAGTPNRTANSISAIQTQLAAINPGDVLEIAAGTYNLSSALVVNRSGTSGSPIYIRGASRTGTIIQRNSQVWNLNASHVIFENMTIQGSGVDSGTTASSIAIQHTGGANLTNITVRNCNITGVDKGVLFEADCQGILIYDNTISGNDVYNSTMIPNNLSWNDDGIKTPGSGNCTFRNDITGFGDSCALAVLGTTTPIGVHFYLNDIRNSIDDAIEFDGARRNCTFYDNRIHNASTAFSIDEHYGGPTIIARNVFINLARAANMKIKSGGGSQNSGFFIYNNTFVAAQYTVHGNNLSGNQLALYHPDNDDWSYYAYQNNIYIYRANPSDGTLQMAPEGHNPVDWSHNSWFPDENLDWANLGLYTSVTDAFTRIPATSPVFSTATKRYTSDNVTVQNPFTTTLTLGADANQEYTGEFVPSLADSTAPRGTGIAIPGITTGFTGGAPDRGAIITGRSLPSWGDSTSTIFPTWRQGQNILEWRRVPNSSPSLSPPPSGVSPDGNSISGRVNAWCSMALDTANDILWICAGGGHTDWAGNEVLSYPLRSNNGSWTLRRNASPGPWPFNVSYYPADGRPSSRHHYRGLLYHQLRDRIYMSMGNWWGTGEGQSRTTDMFNPSTNDWDGVGGQPPGVNGSGYPNLPATFNTSGVQSPFMTYDSNTGDVYYIEAGQVIRWQHATNTFSAKTTNSNNSADVGLESNGAIDTTRNRIFQFGGFRTTPATTAHHFAMPSGVATAVTVTGPAASLVTGNGHGCIYVPQLDAYIVRRQGEVSVGNELISVNASTFECTTLSTTNNTGVSIPGTPPIGAQLWNRFLYSPFFQGAFLIPQYGADVWFIRLY